MHALFACDALMCVCVIDVWWLACCLSDGLPYRFPNELAYELCDRFWCPKCEGSILAKKMHPAEQFTQPNDHFCEVMKDMLFNYWDLGSGMWCLGSGIWCCGFGIWILDD